MNNRAYESSLIDVLGIKIAELGEKQVIATMPVNEVTCQPYGLLHGGASVTLAETVAGVGTYHFIDTNREYAVGIEINANHVRKKRSGFVTAVGKPIHIGQTIMVWDIRINDESGQLICISRCTMGVFPKS